MATIDEVYKRVNINGVPCIQSVGVTSDGTTTTVAFNPYKFRTPNYSGAIWVKINQAVATGTEPVRFSNAGGAPAPLLLSNGTNATTADIVTTGGGVFLCFYDGESNNLFLIS